jgi:hypothetical protein
LPSGYRARPLRIRDGGVRADGPDSWDASGAPDGELSWLDADETQERPGDAAVESLWRSVEIHPIEETLPEIEAYLRALRVVFANGGAVFASFGVTGNREFDWFATRSRWAEMAFFSQAIAHPAVRRRIPEVSAGARLAASFEFERKSPRTLNGEFARALVTGGAYRQFEGPPQAAADLAARCCEALFGDRFLDIDVFRCGRAWSPWFFDVAWDVTWVIIDRRLQRVSFLFTTDTD